MFMSLWIDEYSSKIINIEKGADVYVIFMETVWIHGVPFFNLILKEGRNH